MSDDLSAAALPLASEFPQATDAEWRDLVDGILKGAAFDSKLVSTTYDELSIQPLYLLDESHLPDPAGFPGLAPFTRGARAAGPGSDGWDLRQIYLVADGEADSMLADLAGGTTSLMLRLDGPTSIAELGAALSGVLLDVAPVALAAGPFYAEAAVALIAEWDRQALPASARLGSLRADPLGALARHGVLGCSADEALAGLAGLASQVLDTPGVRSISVDATPYADGGASDTDEVAFSLATGVSYLRALTGAGFTIDDALAQIEFSYTATADQFATICKLRAARRCWSRVAEASGAAPGAAGQIQHVITSATMMSRRDPWVNLLRTTVACFAAGVGGADMVTVRAFDSAVGVPSALGHRLARNISHLLVDEARLDDVVDQGGGSYFVEAYTDELANAAWERFQAVEADGGMLAGLRSGSIQEAVAATWERRLVALASRRDPLTGVSEYPDVHEAPLEREPYPEPEPVPDPAVVVEVVPLRRLAEPFEKLRDIADTAAAPPSVFLANLGPVAAHTARATFAKNFFEAGGIVAVGNDGFDSTADLVEGFRSSGAPLAVLCSSDELYSQLVPAAAAALKQAGCVRLYLAGRPAERAEADAQAGVDGYIHVGTDVVATLTEALQVAS